MTETIDRDAVIDQWVLALRSGGYRQTVSTLRDEIGFCCLGVLCDVLHEQPSLLPFEVDWDTSEPDEDGDVTMTARVDLADERGHVRRNWGETLLPTTIGDTMGFGDSGCLWIMREPTDDDPAILSAIVSDLRDDANARHDPPPRFPLQTHLAALNDLYSQPFDVIADIVDLARSYEAGGVIQFGTEDQFLFSRAEEANDGA